MSKSRPSGKGFTLVELAVVIAIIAILAAVAIGFTFKGTRNANVEAASEDLVVRLAGLPGNALADGRDRVFVFVDRPSGGGVRARTFILTNPPAGWTLQSFQPDNPGMTFSMVELPEHAKLLGLSELAAPDPFQAVKLYDARMLSTCGGAACFAIRYGGDGEVRGEAPAGGDSGAPGIGFVLADDEDTGASPGARRRAVVLGFPVGAVKSYVP